jgi:hypothetical protein
MPMAMKAAFMPDHAAPDDHDLGRRDAGHAAEQDPAAAERLLEHERAGLGGDLPATSLIGASSGSRPRSSSTVS